MVLFCLLDRFEPLVQFVVRLLLATGLAAAIAYHPRSERRFDTLEEVEAPKSFILYAIVAAAFLGLVAAGMGYWMVFGTNTPSYEEPRSVKLPPGTSLDAVTDSLDRRHVPVPKKILHHLMMIGFYQGQKKV